MRRLSAGFHRATGVPTQPSGLQGVAAVTVEQVHGHDRSPSLVRIAGSLSGAQEPEMPTGQVSFEVRGGSRGLVLQLADRTEGIV